MKLNTANSTAPTRDLASLAGRLEDMGCDGFYFADLSHDALLGAAVAATGSSRMAIGTSIALAFTRSPTALAYAAHDLNTASEGRFVLGLGPQVRPHIERRFGLTWSEPVKRMRETVLAMRAVWHTWQTGEPLSFAGDLIRLSLMPPAFRPEPTPWGGPPVYLAAVGPKMAELAGEVADGLFVHAFATPDYVRDVLLPAIERGLARSGRTRADFQLSYSAFIADTAAAETPAAAREQARASVAFYASTPDYVRVLDQHGLGDLQPKLRQMTREGAWAQMAGEIGDEVLDLFCPTGTPGEIGAALAQRWDGLVDQISLPVDFWRRHGTSREWQDAAALLKR
ncbi:MAG: TIGR03617 family F420-dependent LLM class oxidoreductase [Sphingomonadales bacterium]|nr:TIGR03617 family F420-dependent LLM class oxidoreductase [Sphingomonadales bacterium]